MENFIKDETLEFEDDELSSLIKQLNKCFENNQKNFCETCKAVFEISDWFDKHQWYYKDKNNYWHDKYELFGKFGLDRTAVHRMSNCYKRFMVDSKAENSTRLTYYFKDFSPSKLFELLKLSDESVCDFVEKDLIKSTMTVKQIREFIKAFEKGENPATKVLEKSQETETEEDEEIPMAYNPKQHYDFDYFENKTKAQLLNIVWELQKEYEKLKEKRK
jgi:hypothetical protein